MARIFWFLGALFLLAQIITFFYYWDPSRVFLMGLKEKNSFSYEMLEQSMLDWQPEKELEINHQNDVETARAALQNVLLGSSDLSQFEPTDIKRVYDHEHLNEKDQECPSRQEAKMSFGCLSDTYAKWDDLAAVDRLRYAHDEHHASFAFHFRPKNPLNQVVIYHHGYASSFHSQHVLLGELVSRGYHVLAFNFALYGDNAKGKRNVWGQALNGNWQVIETPLSIIFAPIMAAMNSLSSELNDPVFHMMGLSAGGWTTAVTAALDPRIQLSFPIAGVLPLAIRQGDKERAAPQFYPPMLEAASYLDMFVMAADRAGRGQQQIFNRYDRCCFNNVRGRLYEKAVSKRVQKIGGGWFDVFIDESHARHKISRKSFNLIIETLESRQ